MQIKLLINLDYFYQSCGIQNDFLMFTRMIDEVILAYIALSIDLWFIKWGPDTSECQWVFSVLWVSF